MYDWLVYFMLHPMDCLQVNDAVPQSVYIFNMMLDTAY